MWTACSTRPDRGDRRSTPGLHAGRHRRCRSPWFGDRACILSRRAPCGVGRSVHRLARDRGAWVDSWSRTPTENRRPQARPVGEPTQPAPVARTVVFLATKAQDLPAVASAMPPLLGAETCVVTLQNGIPWWYFHVLRASLGGPTPAIGGSRRRARAEYRCVAHRRLRGLSGRDPAGRWHGAARRGRSISGRRDSTGTSASARDSWSALFTAAPDSGAGCCRTSARSSG